MRLTRLKSILGARQQFYRNFIYEKSGPIIFTGYDFFYRSNNFNAARTDKKHMNQKKDKLRF